MWEDRPGGGEVEMNFGKRGGSTAGAIGCLCFSLALATTELGCGSDGGSPGGSGGSGGGNSGNGGSISMPSCAGAFAKVQTPYSANSGFDDLSVFAADEQGLVFSALPDSNLGENASDLPNLLMAADLAGNLSTLRESKSGFFSNLVFDGDDLIFTEGFFGRSIVRLPRKGGTETVLAEDVREGAFADDRSLYYFALAESGGTALFSLPRAGGAATLMVNRGFIGLRGFAFEGDTLYWGEEPTVLDDHPVSIYRMQVNATQPTLIAEIPSDTAGGLNVSGGVVYSTLISDSFDIETYRVEAGKAPTLMGETGLPLIVTDGKAYYGSSSGLTRNTLQFDAPTTVDGTAGKSIYAIGTGPSDLWYATLGCLYRTAK
jgi:hypothetical protein